MRALFKCCTNDYSIQYCNIKDGHHYKYYNINTVQLISNITNTFKLNIRYYTYKEKINRHPVSKLEIFICDLTYSFCYNFACHARVRPLRTFLFDPIEIQTPRLIVLCLVQVLTPNKKIILSITRMYFIDKFFRKILKIIFKSHLNSVCQAFLSHHPNLLL